MEPFHILLIEDNEGDALLTRIALEEAGISFEMSIAMDGNEAIEFLNKQGRFANASTPQLILLDINLPKKNGHEVLTFVKQSTIINQLPVVMLTTSSSKKDIDLSYANGAAGFITKPSDVNDFFEEVVAVVNLWISKQGKP